MRHPVLAVIVISAVAGNAAAQSKTIAEQLFNEARDLVKAGKWAEACPKFEASFKQDPALGTRLNLASCYEHIGKLATAWGLYRESADLAAKAGDTKRSDYAQKQALVLERRLPKLAITPPPKPPAGLTVQRDGAPVNGSELGLALYVDPGVHEVTASAPGFEAFSQQVTLVEGKSETFAIPNLTPKLEPVRPPSTPQPPAMDTVATTPVSPTRRYVGLGIAGAGIAVVGVGLIIGAQAISDNNKAKQLCGNNLACSAENFDAGSKFVSDGRSKATVSTVLVIAGAAAVAGGAVVYLTAPRARERTTAARLVPVIHATGGGLGLTGTF
jgi:tetratricopeptide (TPR) repeat protein